MVAQACAREPAHLRIGLAGAGSLVLARLGGLAVLSKIGRTAAAAERVHTNKSNP